MGFSLVTVGISDVAISLRDRRWSIWDIIVANRVIASAAISSAITTSSSTRNRSSNDGHHTIPIYLCGSNSQELSYIERRRHAALHSGLSAIRVSLDAAENAADRLIPLGRRRTNEVMSLADTQEGRSVVANAIETYYQVEGWWGEGTPSIGTVFPNEGREFVNGKTSLPECKRSR